jgi:alpha-beta hydrolase superfamily lysophospholipase
MEAWADHGIASVAIDLRGHGRSAGRRGYCGRFDEYLDDTLELERLIAETKAPALLFGHSFGGLVATCSALARPAPWRALLLSSPFFDLAMNVPKVQLAVTKIVSRVFPTFSGRSGIRSSDITHDSALVRAYEQDPLVFHIATARWYAETVAAQDRARKGAASILMPLYVLFGTADRIARPQAARDFFDHAGSRDKTLDVREGLYHEVLNEPEWRGVADRLAEWILAHA